MGHVTTSDLHRMQKRKEQYEAAVEVHTKRMNPPKTKDMKIPDAVKALKEATKVEQVRSLIDGEMRVSILKMAESVTQSLTVS